MRAAIRTTRIVLISLLGAIALTIGAAFSAAFAFGAIALIVPGTGTPNANIVKDYLSQARDRYLKDTACGPTGAGCPNANLSGINYPASFFPLAFIPNWCRSGPDGCDKWDDSVGKGTAELQKQLDLALTTTKEDVVVFGYSQGGAVVSNVLSGYINGLDADTKKRIKIVTIGGIETPDGGLWSRLSPLGFLPFFDVTFGPAMKPDTGVNFISYAFHFDPVADAPRYFGNPFALLNAVAALETVHGYYLTPNGNGPNETLPYGYTNETLAPLLVCTNNPNCRKDSYGNQYVVVPATSLPIADLVYGLVPAALRPVVKPLLELVAPAYRVLAELGYDYGGDPSVSTPASLLPFNPLTFNPVTFAVQFAGAIVQGVTNALGGGTSLSPLNPPETTSGTSIAALSRLSTQQKTGEQPLVSGTQSQIDTGSAADELVSTGTGQAKIDGTTPHAPTPLTLGATTPSTPPVSGALEQKDVVGQNTVPGGSNVVPLVQEKKDDLKKDDLKKDDLKKDDLKKDDLKNVTTKKDDDQKKIEVKKDDATGSVVKAVPNVGEPSGAIVKVDPKKHETPGAGTEPKNVASPGDGNAGAEKKADAA